MSQFHSSARTLPPPDKLQVDLDKYLNHYKVFRSFQRNWTIFPFIHIPIYRPVFGDLAAGDHYFEYKHKVTGKTLISFLIQISPGIDLIEPYFLITSSTLFDGVSIYCFCNKPPLSLPSHIVDTIFTDLPTETSSLLFSQGLRLFLEDYHRPIYPLRKPDHLAEPLENY